MAGKQLLVVFGATGNQGGSVINRVLSNNSLSQKFSLRGVTRDTSKKDARTLESKGVEMVSADVDDPASLEKALSGAHSAFAVTNYWQHLDQEKEFQQGKNIVDAAKKAGVQHLIFSVLIDVTKATNGKLSNVYHFDSKARIWEYILEQGVPGTGFQPGFFATNFASNLQKLPNGLKLLAPYSSEAKIPFFDPGRDTGLFVGAILSNREHFLGKTVPAATGYFTPIEIVEAFNKAKGQNAEFMQVPEQGFKDALAKNKMPDFVQTELYENMILMNPENAGYYGGAEVKKDFLGGDEPISPEEFFRTSPAFKDF